MMPTASHSSWTTAHFVSFLFISMGITYWVEHKPRMTQWRRSLPMHMDWFEYYDGQVTLEQILQLETVFKVRISIMSMSSNLTDHGMARHQGQLLYIQCSMVMSHFRPDTGTHFSLIIKLQTHCSNWTCEMVKTMCQAEGIASFHTRSIVMELWNPNHGFQMCHGLCPKRMCLTNWSSRVYMWRRVSNSITSTQCGTWKVAPPNEQSLTPLDSKFVAYVNKQATLPDPCWQMFQAMPILSVSFRGKLTLWLLVKKLVDYFLEVSEAAHGLEQ